MTLDVYIGDSNDPHFNWNGNNWNTGNTPRRMSPFFPPKAPFYELINNINTDKFDGKKTDWGGWTARVTKKQILDFIKELYANDKTYQTRGMSLGHLYDQMQELVVYVDALENDKMYLLVGAES
jgi:hypothetical protein